MGVVDPTNKLSVVLNSNNIVNRSDKGITLSNMLQENLIAQLSCSTSPGNNESVGVIKLYNNKHPEYPTIKSKTTNVYISAGDNDDCYINNNLLIGKTTTSNNYNWMLMEI